MKDSSGFVVACIDDEEENLNVYRRALRPIADEILIFLSPRKAIEELSRVRVDLVLLDLRMPEMDGHEVLGRLKDLHPGLDVIIVSGRATLKDAVAAIKNGAADLVEKPIQNDQFDRRIRQFRRVWELEREAEALRRRVRGSFDYPDLIGSSAPMQRLKETIANIGPTDIAVLIQGETGTGKELVARAIHHHSGRRNAPFVVVDCGAINESTIESELFGHMKGAFTGATTAHGGLIREADGGTVFLDEVGELPVALQTRLLRMLQEQEVRPVGSTRPVKVDIRVIAATNRDLHQGIAEGTFREDLFYRLSTIALTVPTLRDRAEDIPELAHRFLAMNDATAQGITQFDPAALDVLKRYGWPGNVRELQNAVLRATIFAEAPTVQPIDLPEEVRSTRGTPADRDAGAGAGDEGAEEHFSMESYQRRALQDALEQTGGNKKEAAKLLGIAETTLHRKVKRLLS